MEEPKIVNTPSTGKSLEELTSRARRMALRYAEVSPYRLNPNQNIWEAIVRGLGRQAHTFGWSYCP
jgi:ferredoxin-thioredoxin reductase catalytic subunit